MTIKKDILPKFADTNPNNQEPINSFKNLGYDGFTTKDPILNYDNFLREKSYKAIKFNRYLAIQKASEVIEESFDDDETPYPFVYRGLDHSIDTINNLITFQKGLVYAKHDFSQDGNDDELGTHFYPVKSQNFNLNITSIANNTSYTTSQSTTNTEVYTLNFPNSSGNIVLTLNFTNFLATLQFNDFLVENINTKDISNSNVVGTFSLKINGSISTNFSSTNLARIFNTIDIKPISTILNITGLPNQGNISIDFLTLDYSIVENINNMTINYGLVNLQDDKRYQDLSIERNVLALPTIEDVLIQRMFYYVMVEVNFTNGIDSYAPLFVKSLSSNFDLINSRDEILAYQYTQKGAICSIILKEKIGVNNPTISINPFPLGKRRNYLSFNSSFPVGSIIPFGGSASNIPQGFLFCDGREVLKTTYPKLFNVLQSKWGTSNDTSKFVLPDLRNEFLRGSSSDNPVGTAEDYATLRFYAVLDSNRVSSGSGDASAHPVRPPENAGGVSDVIGAGKSTILIQMMNASSPQSYYNRITFDSTLIWGAEHQANEVRPQNKRVSYIIKAA